MVWSAVARAARQLQNSNQDQPSDHDGNSSNQNGS